MLRFWRTLIIILALAALPVMPSQAQAAQDFAGWRNGVIAEAIEKGISPETAKTALSGVRHLPKVIELDRKQPESRLKFPQYRKNAVNDNRIAEGRELIRAHRGLLEAASANSCGIAPEVIVSLWGMETNFGGNTGGFSLIDALATLAYDGRRSKYFRGELFNALKILDQGHINLGRMKGSWAGAMGQNQFMPSSFLAYAVDGNGDGKRDIWTSLPDVFASTANYLCKSGWQAGERWGRAVRVSQSVPKSLTGLDTKRSMAEWSGMGVTLPNGNPLPQGQGMQASLVIPEGSAEGYLVYNNYRTIMKWNRSVYFATSVGLLADALAQSN